MGEASFAELAEMESGTILSDGYQNGVRFIIKRGPSALCAYVGIPLDHPLAGFSYDDLSLDCHGGLTFSGEGGKGGYPAGWFWYGWDYGHAGDASFYDLRHGGSARDTAWLLSDVRAEIWSVTYDFARLCRLAESIERRSPRG